MTATVGKPPEAAFRFSEEPARSIVLSSSVPVQSEGLMQAPRLRTGHRIYSESDAGSPSSKQRKSRRRRGGKGRWKPYHNMTIEEKMAKDERDERKAVQKRDRLFSHGKPMAPYNTTQFLLEDREKRVTVDSDGDSVSGLAVANGNNLQEVGSAGWQSPLRILQKKVEKIDNICRACSGSDPGGNSSDSGSVSSEEDELEREFEADYDNINFVRIGGMSREEVTKEMLLLERSKGKLEDRVGNLTSENERLKKLLEANNIVYDETQAKRRRSGDSVASEGSGAVMTT